MGILKAGKNGCSCVHRRSGIALLITLFFIMAITVAVGISLSQLQKGGKELHEGRFLVQSSAVLEDVLSVLQNSPMMAEIKDAPTFNVFLESTSVLPFEVQDLRVLIRMQSARGKFNINTLKGSEVYRDALNTYMLRYNILDSYYLTDLLVDCMSGKQDVYKTAIFDDMPWMYRDKIAGSEHLDQILEYYMRTRHDYNVQKLPWRELVRFGEHNSTEIDANYATAEVWQMMLPNADDVRVQALGEGLVVYEKEGDLNLMTDEKEEMKRFDVRYFLPTVHVDVTVQEHNRTADISFEYEITSKKAETFEYGI